MSTTMRLARGAIAGATVAAFGVATGSAAQAAPSCAASTCVALSVQVAGRAAPAANTEVLTAAKMTLSWPVLRKGPNSAWPRVTIRSLQYLLDQRGARLHVDGVFGSKTRAAVIAFQRRHKLPATGVVRAPTWRKLVVTVRFGSRGDAVRAVQDQANFRNLKTGHSLNVDGIFGRKTRTWVRNFQRAMALVIPGFKVDGVVGQQTWKALVSEALSG